MLNCGRESKFYYYMKVEFVEMNWGFLVLITKKNKKEQRGGEK